MTPEWKLYEDDYGQEGNAYTPPEDLEPPLEANNIYANVDIILPRGNEMSRGRVTGRKRDIDGNTTRRAPDNPILYTREYNVQFEDGEVTEFTANVIAKYMYAQCEPDGNQYVLLYDIIDFRKTNSAPSIEDQEIAVRGRASLR